MALDLSNRENYEIETYRARMRDNPELFANNPELVAAVNAEYQRRRLGRPAPATNVDADLDAAKAPIVPDAEVGAKDPRAAYIAAQIEDGWTPEEAEKLADMEATREAGSFDERLWSSPSSREFSRNAAARHRANEARTDAMEQAMANAYGHNSPPVDVNGPSTLTVNGLPVRAYNLSDGKPFGGLYSLGALREAEEQADDARRLANHRQFVADDIERYGHYDLPDTSDKLTPAQYEARVARKRAESAVQDTPRAKELRMQRLAERAGTRERITDDMSDEQRLRAMGRNRQTAQRLAARDMITRRAQAAQNPLEYLGREDINDWQRMVMADRMLRRGAGEMTPLGVQAVGGQNALNMLRGMNLGQGMDNPLVQAQADAAGLQAEQARREMRAADENVLGEKYAPGDTNWLPGWLGGGYNEFTIEEQQQMYDDLINQGYKPAEAQAAVDRQAVKRRATQKMSWNQ